MTATERKPDDPATYADIQSLQDQMDRFESRIVSGLDGMESRLDRMEARLDVLVSELRELRVDMRQHVQDPAAHAR